MSVYGEEERMMYDGHCEDQVEIVDNITSQLVDKDGEPPTVTMDQEKRIRREIANSNERRRMQSINNGFQSLRSLLPHHEGEKLSKAAILQQTAEYIYSLEQEKTRLLSQNCQLKRLVNQHEGGELPPKKRKTEHIQQHHLTTITGVGKPELILPTKCESSSDEGLGSMSPEPVNMLMTMSANTADNTVELKMQLEEERNARMILEDQIRELEGQLYHQQTVYADVDTDIEAEKYMVTESDTEMMVVEADSIPVVGHTQTVVCSPTTSPCPSPTPHSRAPSPTLQLQPPPLLTVLTASQQPQQPSTTSSDVFKVVVVASGNNNNSSNSGSSSNNNSNTAVVISKPSGGGCGVKTTSGNANSGKAGMKLCKTGGGVTTAVTIKGQTVKVTKLLGNSTPVLVKSEPRIGASVVVVEEKQSTTRLPTVLEAAIKAEPKVEVERLPSQSPSPHDDTSGGNTPHNSSTNARLAYVSNTSRQNLETIVEAIRHLEGDHMFSDETSSSPTKTTPTPTNVLRVLKHSQETPLALTTTTTVTTATTSKKLQLLQLTTTGGGSGSGGGGGSNVNVITSNSSSSSSDTLQVEMNPYLEFHTTTSTSGSSSAASGAGNIVVVNTSSLQQSRPGVIVAKQQSATVVAATTTSPPSSSSSSCSSSSVPPPLAT